ncbi:hypothetical protein AVEN_104698-1 [Araneus ventricosus]|uniref:Uncharacterized protein n=1 Tax=Araneus ventricosus TaxID=182803 RepID=A0A4Y2JZ50_ARAVE|nr:hypothetical protein AVEN_104698-1 [Araneus ventricosus]
MYAVIELPIESEKTGIYRQSWKERLSPYRRRGEKKTVTVPTVVREKTAAIHSSERKTGSPHISTDVRERLSHIDSSERESISCCSTYRQSRERSSHAIDSSERERLSRIDSREMEDKSSISIVVVNAILQTHFTEIERAQNEASCY